MNINIIFLDIILLLKYIIINYSKYRRRFLIPQGYYQMRYFTNSSDIFPVP